MKYAKIFFSLGEKSRHKKKLWGVNERNHSFYISLLFFVCCGTERKQRGHAPQRYNKFLTRQKPCLHDFIIKCQQVMFITSCYTMENAPKCLTKLKVSFTGIYKNIDNHRPSDKTPSF